MKQTKMVLPGGGVKIQNRVKAQVLENGKVIRETPWGPNLILDQGMDYIGQGTSGNQNFGAMFKYCCVGTGTTPTSRASGGTTASQTTTAVVASAGIFTSGDVGAWIVYDSDLVAVKITAFTDSTHVTVGTSLTHASGTFKIYNAQQVGLTTELKRSNTYLTGSPNCGSSLAGNVLTMTRTFDFTAEVGSVNYAEVGFSDNASAGTNIYIRALFTGGAVTVLTGQQIRVVYQLQLTITPGTSPRAKTAVITGWPALEIPVTASSSTSLFTLTAHGFTASMAVQFDGTAVPSPLVAGTVYYVNINDANTFFVSATPGGGNITLTTNGTAVNVLTNCDGTEQIENIGMTAVDVNGNVATFDAGGQCMDPQFQCSIVASNTVQAFGTFGAAPTTRTNSGIVVGSLASYTAGNFYRDVTGSFAVGALNQNDLRYFGLTANGTPQVCYGFYFNWKQKKDNLHTLALTFRRTWGRVFS